MKIFGIMLSILLVSLPSLAFSNSQDVCESGNYGKWTRANYIINNWECYIQAEHLGGLTVGLGPIFQVMAGEAEFACTAYDMKTDEIIGCYREEAVIAGIGKGYGAGLRIVTGLKAKSYGLTLIDFSPEDFLGAVEIGLTAEAGFALGDLERNGSAELKFSPTNGWTSFSLRFSDYETFGGYIGGTVNGFVLAKKGSDRVLVDAGDAISDWFTSILEPLRDRNIIGSMVTLSPENFRPTDKSAAAAANSDSRADKTRGVRVYRQHVVDQDQDPTQANFIALGMERAANTCGPDHNFVTAYAAFECESDLDCDYAYFRAVCQQN